MIEVKVKESCKAVDKTSISVKCGDSYVCCQAPVHTTDEDAAKKSPDETVLKHKDCQGGHICTTKIGACQGDVVLTATTEPAQVRKEKGVAVCVIVFPERPAVSSQRASKRSFSTGSTAGIV